MGPPPADVKAAGPAAGAARILFPSQAPRGRCAQAKLTMIALLLWLLLVVASPVGAASHEGVSTRDLLGAARQPLFDNCTAERVLLKAWARKTTLSMTRAAKVYVKVKPTRNPLVNATLVLSVSPDGAGVYKKSSVRSPLLPVSKRGSKRRGTEPVVINPGNILWRGLTVKSGKSLSFKVKFDLTECAAPAVSISASLLYQGSQGAPCAVGARPVEVSWS